MLPTVALQFLPNFQLQLPKQNQADRQNSQIRINQILSLTTMVSGHPVV